MQEGEADDGRRSVGCSTQCIFVSFLSPVGMQSARMAPGAGWRVVCW